MLARHAANREQYKDDIHKAMRTVLGNEQKANVETTGTEPLEVILENNLDTQPMRSTSQYDKK